MEKEARVVEKWKKALRLYLYFFRIGWFTFGGGWSIVAQMQKDFVEDRGELTGEELLDLVSVGRSLPGTMIGNAAYLFGYHMCGVPGGVLSVLGIVTPPLIILSLVTFFYGMVRDNIYVERALTGVRAAVVPIIACAAVRLCKGAFPRRACYVLCAVGCVLSAVFDVSCVLIVLLGVAAGLAMGKREAEET